MLRILAATAFLIAAAGQTTAAFDLVGVQLFGSGADGTWVGNNSQYSTNSSTIHYGLSVDGSGGTNLLLPLTVGVDTFTFANLPGQTGGVGGYAGLNLFFGDVSYNPAAGTIEAGDLTVFTQVNSNSPFSTIAAGTQVASFGASQNYPNLFAVATGATSFLLDGNSISVESFVVNYDASTGNTSGSLTINVSSVPEPSSLLMTGMAAAIAVSWRWSRRLTHQR